MAREERRLMKRWRQGSRPSRTCGALALAAAVALAGGIPAEAPAATRKAPVYRSPGYKGITKAPRTKPPQPPVPVSLGAGEKPSVLVDAAGTAHVAWNEPGGDQPDRLRYCRLKRGERACDATQALVPEQPSGGGNAPGFNDDTAGPRVLALGDELVLLSFRYPNVVGKPDGGSSSTLYAWTSDDGGTTFSEPAIVGNLEPTGGAVVFGGVEDPQIAVITDTSSCRSCVQVIRPGQYDGRRAELGDQGPDQAYSGSLAVDGPTPLAAFADLNNQILVRRLRDGADAGDAASWTVGARFAGAEPRLAGGPSGAFLLSRPGFGKGYEVRGINGDAAGAPTPVSGTGVVGRDFFQDAGGTLYAGWVDRANKEVELRTSSDGKRWNPLQVLLRSTGEEPGALDLGGASDGGGFAVVQQGGEILATGFGSFAPTNVPGLGSLAGGSGGGGATAGCNRATFGAVEITPAAGCLLGALDPKFKGAKVATGTVRLNGLEIVPDANVKIVVNAREHTLDTTGSVRVLLRAPGVGEITLWHGELHVKLPVAGAGARLFSFDTEKFAAALKGFPIKGKIDVELLPDAVRIPVSLGLPKIFGEIRGDAVLEADEIRGLHVDSLSIDVADAFVGPLLLSRLHIGYMASGDQWDGTAILGLPPQPGGAKLEASVTFKGGAFSEGFIAFTPPYPGIAAGPAVFITRVGGGFALDPVTINAEVGFGAIPILPSRSFTLGVDGKLKIVFGDPTTFTISGIGKLFDVPIASAEAFASTDGYFSAKGDVNIDLKLVTAGGSFQGFVDGRRGLFGGEAAGSVKILGFDTIEGKFVVSSNGVGGCYSLAGIAVGFGYHFGDPIPLGVDVMLLTCDLEPYKVVATGARAAQAGGGRPFPVAAGVPSQQLEITGAEGAPSVVLVSPTGERIVPAEPGTAGARAVAVAQPEAARTIVGIPKPAAGTWQVEAAEGSTAIAEVRTAAGLTPPKVTARVSGSGRERKLTYTVTDRPGLAVTFAERARGGTRVIGTAKGAKGSFSFEAGDGPGGRRPVEALVESNGAPRSRTIVTRYKAPGPIRPARVSGVRVKRSGKKALVVSWPRVRDAGSYVVRINVADGRRQMRLLRASAARRVRLADFSRGDRATVTVTARSAAGRSGRPSRPVSLKG